MDYESPIQIYLSQMQGQLEDGIYNAVRSYGIDVNKDELIKALVYDRQQYEKGFKDGVRKFAEELISHFFYDLERLGIFEEDIRHFAEKMVGE